MKRILISSVLLTTLLFSFGCKKEEKTGSVAVVNNHPSCYIVVRLDGGDANTINIGSGYVYDNIAPGPHAISVSRWVQGVECTVNPSASQCDFEVTADNTATITAFENNGMIDIHCPN